MSSKESGNEIRLVAIDLDGTLLTPDGRVTARNARAIGRACDAGVSVVLATGKSRASARAIIEALELHMPGVFTQGTTVYDETGKIWHEMTMAKETAAGIVRFAEAHSFSYLAYVGERLLMPAVSPLRRRMAEQYHEPLPEVVGSLSPLLDNLGINKLVVEDPVDDGEARAALYQLFDERAEGGTGGAHVTQAVPHLIELLPAGASKGAGLRWLLAQLEIDVVQVMAIGDGENDLEMMALAGWSVAMGNGHPRVKEAARFITGDNTDSGVAQAIERYVLGEQ